MYKDHSILAIIPARGGSKGIPGKNIFEVSGKPLIAYTLEAASGSQYIDYVLVSTDSQEIADTAKKYGGQVPFLRPAELASDTAKTIDAVVHCVKEMKESQMQEFESVVLLQPTSPLRTSEDIDGAIELFYQNDEKSLVSVSELDVNPVLIRRIEDGRAVPILNESSTVRRQDFKKYYRVNGAIYINRACELTPETSLNDNETAYIMDSSHCIDIDSMDDIEALKRQLS